jgi:hypothetical protein
VKEIRQPPNAAAIVNSLRAIGYSFNTAVADIIDNSIAAGASAIEISFRVSPAYVAITDDGCGMTEAELILAMRHGGTGPSTVRQADDLGRYGLGLKTASLSQCRRLTVVSLSGGSLCAARWDLDEIERQNDWILTLPDEEEARNLPGVADLLRTGRGTAVLWENLDRATAGDSAKAEALQRLVLDCGDHLSLVFHRYLAPERGRGLTVLVNGRTLEPADPFMLKNPYTEFAGEETHMIDGEKVGVKAYILPHIGKMTPDELEHAGGRQRLRDTQGFYVYRNRRLITYGTWFRLLGRDELTRLARIQIDTPNALDHLWGLDVKKSTASPPEAVRTLLRQIIQIVADKSTNVFKERQRRGTANADITYLWERSKVRGGLRYGINRAHPLVAAFTADLTTEQLRQLERIFSAVELALPVRQIYVDQASNEPVEQSTDDITDALTALLEDLVRGTEPNRRRALIDDLLHVEPFRNHPAITRSIIEAMT